MARNLITRVFGSLFGRKNSTTVNQDSEQPENDSFQVSKAEILGDKVQPTLAACDVHEPTDPEVKIKSKATTASSPHDPPNKLG